MAAKCFLCQIERTRRNGENWFIVQETFNISCQILWARVASIPILFDRLEHDAIEVTMQQLPQSIRLDLTKLGNGRSLGILQSTKPSRRFGSIGFSDLSAKLIVGLFLNCGFVDWCGAGKQFVKQDSEAINVAACIDIESAQPSLFGTHIRGSPHQLHEACIERFVRQTLSADCLRQAEVNYLDNRFRADLSYQNVRRFDIAMDDPFLMRVLNGVTNGLKKLEPFTRCCLHLIAVFGDRDTADQFHDEVGTPIRRSCIKHSRNIRMFHEGQRLPFGLEASDDLLGIHARLDNLQGDLSLNRFGLFSDINNPHPAFADLFANRVGANSSSRIHRDCRRIVLGNHVLTRDQRPVCQVGSLPVPLQQDIDFASQVGVSLTFDAQKMSYV